MLPRGAPSGPRVTPPCAPRREGEERQIGPDGTRLRGRRSCGARLVQRRERDLTARRLSVHRESVAAEWLTRDGVCTMCVAEQPWRLGAPYKLVCIIIIAA